MGTRTVLLVPLVPLIAAADAKAQPPGKVAPRAELQRPAKRKSPIVAASLSAGIPLAGLGVALASRDAGGVLLGGLAMYIGPSIGRWYAGGGAAIGLLGRTAGGVVMLVGLQKGSEPTPDCEPDVDPTCHEADEAEAAREREFERWVFAGAAIWGAATVYDVVMAYRNAGEHNREAAATLAPVVVGGGASTAVGLGVSGRF